MDVCEDSPHFRPGPEKPKQENRFAIGGAIDASSFTDEGKTHIVYKNDGNSKKPKREDTLWVQQVCVEPGKGGAPAKVKLDGVPIRTLSHPAAPGRPGTQSNSATQGKLDVNVTIEAPQIIVHHTQDGTKEYTMFYSTGAYNKDSYTEWYATATNLHGPWTSGKLLESGGDADGGRKLHGPGGATVLGNLIVFENIAPTGPLERETLAAPLQWKREGGTDVPYVKGGLRR